MGGRRVAGGWVGERLGAWAGAVQKQLSTRSFEISTRTLDLGCDPQPWPDLLPQ